MKISLRYLALVSLVLFFTTSCRKDNPSNLDQIPKKLIIKIQNEFVSLPSKVSVFFRVEDEEGNPVAYLGEDDFTILEKGRNDTKSKLISEDEAARTISDNKEVFKYDVFLLLDLSGSVIKNNLPALKIAAKKFVSSVIPTVGNSSTRLGVFWFDGMDVLHSLIDFTSNRVAIETAIDGINGAISNDYSTDLFGAVIKASELAKSKIKEHRILGFQSAASVIVFTDGTDQAARYSKDDAYAAIDENDNSINYYTIGLGNEIDATVLKKIGTKSSVFADNSADLETKFEEIAKLIYSEGNSFYLFEYCTPKRDGSGINELVIKVKDDVGRTGIEKTKFDATGFKAGCSLN